jgi:DNA-directed RNA polymerase specialized sigma24 family protein
VRISRSAERYFGAAQRAVVELHALGYSSEEIALVVDVSPRTVRRWLRDSDWSPSARARLRLRRF